MKNFLRLSFLAVVLTFTFSLQANAQGAINEILKRMDNNYKNLQSLEANVKMEKYNAQLDENDVSQGTVKYLPKTANRVMYVRIDWTKPTEEQIAIIGNEYTLYRPRLKQVYTGKTDSAKNNSKAGNALAFMGMSRAELKANYDVTYLGQEQVGELPTWHLKLIPKSATSYKEAHLWVDVNGMPIMAKIVEKNDDSQTILLSRLQKNITIPANIFRIQYPKNIKPIIG